MVVSGGACSGLNVGWLAGAATAAGGLVSLMKVPSLRSGSRARVHEAAGQALLSSLDKQARH